jgi:hypothetical protein
MPLLPVAGGTPAVPVGLWVGCQDFLQGWAQVIPDGGALDWSLL